MFQVEIVGYVPDEGVADAVLPDGCVRVGCQAMRNQKDLVSVAMPPSVTILSPTSVLSQSPTERPQLAEKRRSHTPLYVEGEYGNRCGGRRAHSAAMKERAANAGG